MFVEDTVIRYHKCRAETLQRGDQSSVMVCYDNSPTLYISMMKEMMVKYIKLHEGNIPICIYKAVMESVSLFVFLGVHITDNLNWTLQTQYSVHQSSKRINLALTLLPRIYCCSMQSILTDYIVVEYSNCYSSKIKNCLEQNSSHATGHGQSHKVAIQFNFM